MIPIPQEEDECVCGTIEIIIGPMYSGKTNEISRRLRCASFANKKSLWITHQSDKLRCSSDDTLYHTHNEYHDTTVKIEGVTYSSINELPSYDQIKDYDIVAVDEAQFFGNLQIIQTYVEHVKKEIRVIVSGLTTDFKRNKFGNKAHIDIVDLIRIADSVKYLHAVCVECRRQDALFTH